MTHANARILQLMVCFGALLGCAQLQIPLHNTEVSTKTAQPQELGSSVIREDGKEGENSQWLLKRASSLLRSEKSSRETCTQRSFIWLGAVCDGMSREEGVQPSQDVCETRIGIAESFDSGQPGDQEVFLLSTRDGACLELGRLPSRGDHFRLSRDKTRIVAAYRNAVSLIDLPSLQLRKKLERLSSDIQSLDLSPVDDIALIGGGDGRIYRWRWKEEYHPSEPATGRFDLERYFSHSSVVSAVRFHPSGRIFFSGDWSGNVVAVLGYEQDAHGGRYDKNIFGTGFFTDATRTQKIQQGRNGRIEDLVASHDGKLLFVSEGSGAVTVWQLRGLSQVARFAPHRGMIKSLAISPQVRRIATYGRDQRVVITELQSRFDSALGKTMYRSNTVQEWAVPGVQVLTFIDESTLLVGTAKGLQALTVD